MLSKKPRAHLFKSGRLILLILAFAGLSGCYYPAPYHRVAVVQPAPDYGVRAVAAPAAPAFIYPKTGQTPEQQDRDRYECYNWAVNQTDFDPSRAPMPVEQRVIATPVPAPGHDTAVLGIGGAVIGALIGGPRHALGGALIGGATGALVGAASDTARQDDARRTEAAINSRRDQVRESLWAGKANDFRRAMSACLEGRGYTVQ